MYIQTTNPTTGQILESYKEFQTSEVLERVECCHRAYLEWRLSPFEVREKCLKNLANLLRQEKQELANLITLEMAKPISQSQSEIEKCALLCEYYAENASGFLASQALEETENQNYIEHVPLGVVLGVMPWNFPFWQVFRFAVPALTAGNGCLLKHASNVCGCSLAIEHLFEQAGFPEHLITSLIVRADKIPAVIRHDKVQAVTLTGGLEAGRSVAAVAGDALKKTVMELGGSDPYIILPDADIEAAARLCVKSRLINSGQSCIAAKRFIVVESLQNEFEEAMIENMRAAKMKDPHEADCDIGPLATTAGRRRAYRQVRESIALGAECPLGDRPLDDTSNFYSPTLLSNVNSFMPAYKEEVFAPVASIIPTLDEETAILVANNSVFGLGAAVFSQDLDLAKKMASQLECGCCFINDYVRSDPALPFGGIKKSGYGRELSAVGIKEFVNVKTVSVNTH